MIELLDDFYHVKQACANLAKNPGDRFLVSFLNCYSGESVFSTRALSFLCILLTCWFLLDIFFGKEYFLKLKNEKWKILFFFFLISHTMVLFPFIYASQFSTSLTLLWATLAYTIILKSSLKIIYQYAMLFIMGLLGSLIRLEANFFLLMIIGSHIIFLYCLYSHSKHILMTNLSSLLSKKNNLKIVFTIGIFYIFHLLFHKLLPSTSSQLEIVTNSPSHYPGYTYHYVQTYAIAQYLKNVILPGFHSFYGSWLDWWELYQKLSLARFLAIIFISAECFLLFLIVYKKVRRPFKFLAAGLFLFIAECLVFSIIPRSDWYYPSRQYMGTIFLLIFFLAGMDNFIANLNLKKISLYSLISYFAFSSFYSFFFHYANEERFYLHEKFVTNHIHPFARIKMGTKTFNEGDYDTALATFHNVYSSIPREAALVSSRAAVLWLLGIYGGYISSEKLQLSESSKQALNLLVNSTYFVGTLACLQDSRIPLSKCQEKDKRVNFCVYALNRNFPRLNLIYKLRIPISEYCKGLIETLSV